ncbi:MAG: adenosylcobinamide-GDP ribazoletransferase [Deltaproteobacteria bacterium]|jgi:adenosylcobinamide-GDP ribazoletransferase|nr:adenosylcobinamide-GDP ribazoletransferase [Deltaproteobacteria bacterium]
MFKIFRHSLAFLTILPVSPKSQLTVVDMGRFPGYYPLVGVVLGAFSVLAFWFWQNLGLPDPITAVFIVAFQVILTRGFHLDGVADTADALLSHKPLEKRFEILKDSHLGTFGVTAVVLDIILKISFITLISPYPIAATAIFLYPIWGRVTASVVAVLSKNARPGPGLGFNMVEYSCFRELFLAILTTTLISLIFGASTFLTSLLVLLFSLILIPIWHKSLGGVTGDLLGASLEIGEIASLTFFVLLCLPK